MISSLVLVILSSWVNKEIRAFTYPIQTLRLLVAFKKFDLLKKIIFTLRYVLPEASSFAIIMFLIMLIYMFIGVDIFAYVKPQNAVGGIILNFRNLHGVYQALMRTITGESWHLIYADVAREQSPNFTCEEIYSYDEYVEFGINGCGSKRFAIAYFFTFTVLILIIILNLFVAMLLSAVDELSKIENSSINTYHLNDIKRIWKKYDPHANGYINYKPFWKFTSEIAIILKIPVSFLMDIDKKIKLIDSLNIPVYENTKSNIYCFKYQDTILSLSKLSLILRLNIITEYDTFKLELNPHMILKRNLSNQL